MYEIKLTEDEYEMVLEALRLTRYIKFINDKAKEEYRELGIRLGDTDE